MKPRIRVLRYNKGWIAVVVGSSRWYWGATLIKAARGAYEYYELTKNNFK